jgi:hypothetical protein
MTVRELREILFQMDQDMEVMVWNTELGMTDPIDRVEVDQDEVVIF